MRNVAVKKRYVNGGVRLSFFVQEGDIKPGEYCLIPVAEASPDVVQTALKASYEIVLHDLDKAQARIAELEKQLATRSPGVMPECVKKMVEAAESNHIISYDQEKALAKAVRDYYAPKFVFDGSPALYEVKMDSGAEIRCDVYQTRKGPVLDWYNGALISLNSDGTFPGGRITRRVG